MRSVPAVAVVLSGPPLLLGLIFGKLAKRYELVLVARRSDAQPPTTDAPQEERTS
jgi:hypothetical protein